MAPKRRAASGSPAPPTSGAVPSAPSQNAGESSKSTSGSATTPSSSAPITFTANSPPQEIVLGFWQRYISQTSQRTLLLDAFMGFLVVVGILQFVYCVLAGNYVRFFRGFFYADSGACRNALVPMVALTDRFLRNSLSMHFSADSLRRSANSFSQPVCGCRQRATSRRNQARNKTVLETRSLAGYPASGTLPRFPSAGSLRKATKSTTWASYMKTDGY